jgi:hypothetical protein
VTAAHPNIGVATVTAVTTVTAVIAGHAPVAVNGALQHTEAAPVGLTAAAIEPEQTHQHLVPKLVQRIRTFGIGDVLSDPLRLKMFVCSF